MDDDAVRARARWATAAWPTSAQLHGGIRYVSGGYDDPETYKRLAELLDELDAAARHLRQPAVLPVHPGRGVRAGDQRAGRRRAEPRPRGLLRPPGDREAVRTEPRRPPTSWTRIVHAAFDEPQVFRIDHYLGKDTVQNVLALRFANSIFQPIWDRTWVDHVQITVAETLGVGTRGGFYENAGAMRDIVQNHVLQVLALALMEPPASFDAEGLRNEKVKLLQAIRLPTDRDIADLAVRGQYTRGGTRDDLMAGLPRGARRRPAVAHRDVRGDAAQRGQLALGRGAVLRPYRQAAAGPGDRGGAAVPAAAAPADPDQPADRARGGRADAADPAQRGHLAAVRGQGARALVPGPDGEHGLLVRQDVPRRSRPRRTSGCCSTRCWATRRCSSAPTRSSSAGGSSTRSSSTGPRTSRRSRRTRRRPGVRPTRTG